MEYLTRWRMLLAGERLVSSEDTVAAIAVSVGYDSESAFGAAFQARDELFAEAVFPFSIGLTGGCA